MSGPGLACVATFVVLFGLVPAAYLAMFPRDTR